MRRFEHGGSKFWEIETTGSELRLRFGKLGANGQLKLQTYGSPAEATAAADKQIAGKLKEGYAEIGAAKAAKAAKPAKAAKASKPAEAVAPTTATKLGWQSDIKATTVKLKELGTGNDIHRIAIFEHEGGPAAVAAGENASFGTTNGSKWHRRPESPGLSYGLFAYDNILYSMGGPLMVSSNGGETWKSLKAPVQGYIFTLFRDSTGLYWLGCDDGAVFTATSPGKWTKAKFKTPGKVMAFEEVDGKLIVVGAGSGEWNGKKFTKYKMKETITRVTEGPEGGLVMVGDGGIAYRSKDRGKTWTKVKSGVKEDIEDLAWVAGSLFAVGGSGYYSGGGFVLRSDDEGKSWKNVAKTEGKLWTIESWGDGAIVGGSGGVGLLSAPNDSFWKGRKDLFVPPPIVADAQFKPLEARSDKELTSKFDKLYAKAIADHERVSAKQRSARVKDANPKLAAAVDEGADGAEAVYADWLSESGDPRGELAQIQIRLEKDPKNKELKKAEKALLKEHSDAFLGAFAKLSDVVELEWKAGFITKARIANVYTRDPDFGDGDEDSDDESKKEVNIANLVEELVTMPSGRFLRDLTVGIVRFTDNDYGGVAAKLGKHYLPALRSLFLGDFTYEDTELNWSSIGKLEPLYGAVPNLEKLKLRSGGAMTLGAIVLPNLKSFEVITGGMPKKALQSIIGAVWPSLELLSIQTGPEAEGVKSKDLAPILDGDALPKLKTLRLDNMNFTHELVEPLATSKVLPQLDGLGLAMGTLDDQTIRKMFTLQKAFAHLSTIDVTDNYLSNDSKKLFKQFGLKVTFGEQRDDDDDGGERYASAYE
ncbi:MAG: WGR domain-containing protein [Kofleriaceae bacterium]